MYKNICQSNLSDFWNIYWKHIDIITKRNDIHKKSKKQIIVKTNHSSFYPESNESDQNSNSQLGKIKFVVTIILLHFNVL